MASFTREFSAEQIDCRTSHSSLFEKARCFSWNDYLIVRTKPLHFGSPTAPTSPLLHFPSFFRRFYPANIFVFGLLCFFPSGHSCPLLQRSRIIFPKNSIFSRRCNMNKQKLHGKRKSWKEGATRLGTEIHGNTMFHNFVKKLRKFLRISISPIIDKFEISGILRRVMLRL